MFDQNNKYAYILHYTDYGTADPVDDASEEEMRRRNTTSKADHGERTNRKLRSQPFYQRQRNGKMKHY